MPNILLTTTCNLACTYCFAREKMEDKPNQTMSLDNVRKVITFLKHSNYQNFRMMGGEPTFHPHFQDIVQLALQEGMHLDLLSNATWPAKYNDLFARISPNNLLFLLNIGHPDNYPTKRWAKIEDNLAPLTNRKGVSLSFNIFSKTPDYNYIFDLTDTYGIRTVRLSFSLPVLGIQNARLDIEEYAEMSAFIMEFVQKSEAKGVSVQLDNAVPLCIFTYAQAGELLLKGILDLKRNARCKPIVDIAPDLSLWCCFCLSKIHNRHLDEFTTLKQVERYYEQAMKPYQDEIFPMEQCYECTYRTLWGCQGGCTTFSIEKNRSENLPLLQPGKEPHSGDQAAILALGDNVSITKYELPRESYVLRNHTTGAQVEVGPSFERLFHLLDGQLTTQELTSAFLCHEQTQKSSSWTAMDIFERQIMEESFQNMLHGFLQEGFIVSRPAKTAEVH